VKGRHWLATSGLFLLLVALHYSTRPLFEGRVGVDFLLLAVLLAGIRLRPGAAAVLGFTSGLVSDALAPGSFGAGALALTVVAFGASWMRAAFFAQNFMLFGALVFIAKVIHDVVVVLLSTGIQFPAAVLQLLVWTPLGALASAVAAVALAAMFKLRLEWGDA
jgi:rod shape-determining protein MreD